MAGALIHAKTDDPGARHINPMVSVLKGDNAHKDAVSLTTWNSTSSPNLRVRNENTGGEGLVAYAADFATKILATNNTGVTMAGTLGVTGTTTLGTLAVTTANVTTANVGTLVVSGNTTLGDAAGDAVTVNAAASFFNTLSVRNGAGSVFPLWVDVANNRVVMGNGGAAVSGAASDLLTAVGQTYLMPASAGEIALNVWRSTAAGAGWGIGVTASDQLKFTDNGGQGILTVGDTSSTYQLEVTGDAHVTEDTVIDGDVSAARAVFGGTTFSGTEELRVVGQSRLEGDVTMSSGTLALSSGNIDVQSGTAGQIRVGSAIVNAASLSGSEVLRADGDILMSGTGRRLQADWSNATLSSRAMIQSSTTNGFTFVGALPNGTSTIAGFAAYNNSTPGSSRTFLFYTNGTTNHIINSANDGGGTNPIVIQVGGTTRIQLDTTGIGFFGSTPIAKPTVSGSRGGNAALDDLCSELANLGLITNSTTA